MVTTEILLVDLVDTMHQDLPDFIKDMHWDVKDVVLPYTEAALQYHQDESSGSPAFVEAPEAKAVLLETNDPRLSIVEVRLF